MSSCWHFGRKLNVASKMFFLVMNKTIRIYGNCDEKNSDKLKWGEMWITSALQDTCQIYWTQQGQCVRHCCLTERTGMLSSFFKNKQLRKHHKYFNFWKFYFILRVVCITYLCVFFSQWGVLYLKGMLIVTSPTLLSLEIKYKCLP